MTRRPQRAVPRFALAFVALVFVFAASMQLEHVLLDDALTTAFVRRVASAVAALTRLGGAPASASDDVVSYGTISVRIVPDCTGLDMLVLYAAGVLAFPAACRQKLTGLAVGLPVLTALNLVRMVTLVYVAAWSRSALEYGHVWVWPLLLLAASTALWMAWVRRVTGATDLLV
jgi:exosortase H (IPTLxxWG-CTERM-specific)